MFEQRRLTTQLVVALAKNRAAGVSAIFLFLLFVIAASAQLIAPFDPLEINAEELLLPPSAEHWFGTDDTGRDVLSRVIWGARLSLRIGLISSGIATFAGLVLGLVSGFFGGLLSFVILRAMDLLLAFPGVCAGHRNRGHTGSRAGKRHDRCGHQCHSSFHAGSP